MGGAVHAEPYAPKARTVGWQRGCQRVEAEGGGKTSGVGGGGLLPDLPAGADGERVPAAGPVQPLGAGRVPQRRRQLPLRRHHARHARPRSQMLAGGGRGGHPRTPPHTPPCHARRFSVFDITDYPSFPFRPINGSRVIAKGRLTGKMDPIPQRRRYPSAKDIPFHCDDNLGQLGCATPLATHSFPQRLTPFPLATVSAHGDGSWLGAGIPLGGGRRAAVEPSRRTSPPQTVHKAPRPVQGFCPHSSVVPSPPPPGAGAGRGCSG